MRLDKPIIESSFPTNQFSIIPQSLPLSEQLNYQKSIIAAAMTMLSGFNHEGVAGMALERFSLNLSLATETKQSRQLKDLSAKEMMVFAHKKIVAAIGTSFDEKASGNLSGKAGVFFSDRTCLYILYISGNNVSKDASIITANTVFSTHENLISDLITKGVNLEVLQENTLSVRFLEKIFDILLRFKIMSDKHAFNYHDRGVSPIKDSLLSNVFLRLDSPSPSGYINALQVRVTLNKYGKIGTVISKRSFRNLLENKTKGRKAIVWENSIQDRDTEIIIGDPRFFTSVDARKSKIPYCIFLPKAKETKPLQTREKDWGKMVNTRSFYELESSFLLRDILEDLTQKMDDFTYEPVLYTPNIGLTVDKGEQRQLKELVQVVKETADPYSKLLAYYFPSGEDEKHTSAPSLTPVKVIYIYTYELTKYGDKLGQPVDPNAIFEKVSHLLAVCTFGARDTAHLLERNQISFVHRQDVTIQENLDFGYHIFFHQGVVLQAGEGEYEVLSLTEDDLDMRIRMADAATDDAKKQFQYCNFDSYTKFKFAKRMMLSEDDTHLTITPLSEKAIRLPVQGFVFTEGLYFDESSPEIHEENINDNLDKKIKKDTDPLEAYRHACLTILRELINKHVAYNAYAKLKPMFKPVPWGMTTAQDMPIIPEGSVFLAIKVRTLSKQVRKKKSRTKVNIMALQYRNGHYTALAMQSLVKMCARNANKASDIARLVYKCAESIHQSIGGTCANLEEMLKQGDLLNIKFDSGGLVCFDCQSGQAISQTSFASFVPTCLPQIEYHYSPEKLQAHIISLKQGYLDCITPNIGGRSEMHSFFRHCLSKGTYAKRVTLQTFPDSPAHVRVFLRVGKVGPQGKLMKNAKLFDLAFARKIHDQPTDDIPLCKSPLLTFFLHGLAPSLITNGGIAKTTAWEKWVAF